MWASVRNIGAEMHWNDCDMDDEETDKIEDAGADCNILEQEETLNCKLRPGEKGISMLQKQKLYK